MKNIKEIKLNSTNKEVEFLEPTKDNAIALYNKELPLEFKKIKFEEMPPYWQHRQIHAYCEFMSEVIPNSVDLMNKANTMIGVALAKENFSSFKYEAVFAPTHLNILQHKIKTEINFKFDYLTQPNALEKNEVTIKECDDEVTVEPGDKITNVWNNSSDTLSLASRVFNDFPNLKEQDKIVMTACILLQMQSALDINSKDTMIQSEGFTKESIDPNSDLGQKMACARMVLTFDIDSAQHHIKVKKRIH